jgi:hypothetical protein
VPVAVVIFSWGITANIFGEFFALLSLAVAVGTYGRLSPARPAFWVLALLLMITFLGHPGVLALSMVAFSVTALLWFLTRGGRTGRRAAFGLAGAMVAAVLGAVAVYYRHFIPGMLTTLQTIQAERASGTGAGGRPLVVGGSVEDNSLGLFQREVHSSGEWLSWGLRGIWSEAQAYYRVWPAVGAVFGYVSLRQRTGLVGSEARTSGIRRAAAGWAVAVAALWIVGWASNLFVRYALFALPIVSVGVGVLLGGIWNRGSRARFLCMLLLVFFAVEALGLWQYRINYPFK